MIITLYTGEHYHPDMAMELEPVMECLGNPLKARVMIMIKEHGPLTAKQMLSYDSKIPQASLYRALKSMEEHSILVTVAETKVRAVVEKSYALNDDLRGRVDQMVRNNDGEVYFKLFMGFAFNLMRTFENYSKREGVDLKNDGSGFFAVPVYATKEELEDMYNRILEIIRPAQTRTSADQELHTLAFVATPPEKNANKEE